MIGLIGGMPWCSRNLGEQKWRFGRFFATGNQWKRCYMAGHQVPGKTKKGGKQVPSLSFFWGLKNPRFVDEFKQDQLFSKTFFLRMNRIMNEKWLQWPFLDPFTNGLFFLASIAPSWHMEKTWRSILGLETGLCVAGVHGFSSFCLFGLATHWNLQVKGGF